MDSMMSTAVDVHDANNNAPDGVSLDHPKAKAFRGGDDEAAYFTEMNQLASESVGGKILFATDDWFASAENLLKDAAPVWREGVFTEYGKWMDGWETRRKRSPGHDWCLIRLGMPGIVRGIAIDTAFFTGNYAPRFSLQATCMTPEDEARLPQRSGDATGSGCSRAALAAAERAVAACAWTDLVPTTELRPGYEATRRQHVAVASCRAWTHLRLNMFPDGGIARLHVFGEAAVRLPAAAAAEGARPIDLLAAVHGGLCKGYSNAHYGHPRNLIQAGDGVNMGDGWETARRLDRPPVLEVDARGILLVSGEEWACFRLACPGRVRALHVDTSHFKGNFPDSCRVEGVLRRADAPGRVTDEGVAWTPILPTTKLSAHKLHVFDEAHIVNGGPYSHVRITIYPDGGLSRFRVFGTPARCIESE